MPRQKCSLASAAVFALLHAATAAPVDESELKSESGLPGSSMLQDRPNGSVATDAGKRGTLDLLIEMDSKKPGITFNERARPEKGLALGSPTAAASKIPKSGETPGARPAPATPSGLFGNAVVDPSATGRVKQEIAPPAWQPRSAEASGGQESARHGSGENPPVLSFVRSAVLYVRENREWFISGAIAMLLMMWFATGGAGRRR